MKVEYLFSRNKKIGSRLIAWAASYEKLPIKEIPSHCAILLDETWVIESTLFTGVRVAPYEKWKIINEELYRIPCVTASRDSKETLSLATSVWNKGYDWPGVLYFLFCYVQLILFKRSIPKENKWQKKRLYFCTEYMAKLTGLNFSMASPAKALVILLGAIK